MKYTNEKQIQILIALLKANNIRKIVASPGTTNITLIKSLQNDEYFEIYSSVDERSAAYIANGLAEESGEVVVLSCTGATASRNYMSGLTEAYYRKLPILAVTSTQEISKVGHHIPQVLDRSVMPNDTVKHSVYIPLIKDNNDLWDCEVKLNNAILELFRNGGGPVHVNLTTSYSTIYDTDKLPDVRVMKRYTSNCDLPPLPKGKISIFIGSHKKIGKDLEKLIDDFCLTNDAVVFCDHTSGYKGKYGVFHALASSQRLIKYEDMVPELTIHIGEITGDYSVNSIIGKEVWRLSEDGEIRDTFRKLKYVFQMPEHIFFKHYINSEAKNDSYLNLCNKKLEELRTKIPETPFSNLWIAGQIFDKIPENCTLHFSILNSLRSWNMYNISKTITTNSNVGGFGIDGCVSSLIGASLVNKDKLYFGIIGDLAFFYDLNVTGNRHVGNNLRIMLVNNGKGTEFRNFNNPGSAFGENSDAFISAGGHFGNKSPSLVKSYSESLGFEYITASNKEEFEKVSDKFLTSNMLDKPMLFEVFTTNEDESDALEAFTSIEESDNKNKPSISLKETVKKTINKIINRK